MGGKQVVRWRTWKHEELFSWGVAASLCKLMEKKPGDVQKCNRDTKNAMQKSSLAMKLLDLVQKSHSSSHLERLSLAKNKTFS